MKDNQQRYYQALEAADQQADSSQFIRFMLSVITQTLAQNAPVNLDIDVAGFKSPTAVALLKTNPTQTRQQLADLIGKDIRTIGRALAKLQQAGKITRVGSDKTGHWELHLKS